MKRRMTKQRETVLAALHTLCHPTADEVYDALRAACPTLGRATVFRNLSVLVEEGRVTRLELPNEAARYDPVPDGHAHFICRTCAKILDLPIPPLRPFPIGDAFVIEQAALTYSGLCRDCAREPSCQS